MALSTKDRQMVELKDTILQLNNTIRALHQDVAEANRREQEHIERERILQEQIDYLISPCTSTIESTVYRTVRTVL